MKIAIISGKGGSGKSSVTAAWISCADRVVAVDCDVDASNLPLVFDHQIIAREAFASGDVLEVDRQRCIGCGVCVDHCRYDALRFDEEEVVVADNLACEACGLCVRLCGMKALSLSEVARSRIYESEFAHGVLIHGSLYPGDDNSGKMIARLRDIADRKMENCGMDLQILDGPPGIGCPVLSTVTGVDCVVIVAEPTLSGMSDLGRAYRVASAYCKDICVVINKADIHTENAAAIRQFAAENNVAILAELPFDRVMVDAQIHCRSVVDFAPESVPAKCLREAFRSVISR